MTTRVALALVALAAAGCVKETARPTVRPAAEDLRQSSPNERAARQAVAGYFALLADWNLPGAYNLLARKEQQKIPFEEYVKACEADRDGIVEMARSAKVAYTGDGGVIPETGKPYVMVVVSVAGEPDAIYGAVPEAGAWRIILTDPRRVVRSQ